MCLSWLVLLLIAGGQGVACYSDYWLNVWASAEDPRETRLLLVYLALSLGAVLGCGIQGGVSSSNDLKKYK